MIKVFDNVKSAGKKYKVQVECKNSAWEVVQDCKTRKITDSSFDNMQDGKLGGHTKKWCGVESYEEALELLEKGYQPTVDELKKEIKGNLMGEGKRISFYNDIVGYAPIVPLAVLGVPNSMINSKMKPIKAKVVDVYYDMTCSSGTSSKDIIKAGAKLLSVIMRLEQQGYRFNVYAIQSYQRDSSCDMLCVKVKDASQPIDLKRVSFPLTHTGFFRVIGFDWYSKVPNGKYRTCYGCGMGYEFDNERLKKMFKEMFGNNAVYLSSVKLLNENAEEYAQEVLAK